MLNKGPRRGAYIYFYTTPILGGFPGNGSTSPAQDPAGDLPEVANIPEAISGPRGEIPPPEVIPGAGGLNQVGKSPRAVPDPALIILIGIIFYKNILIGILAFCVSTGPAGSPLPAT